MTELDWVYSLNSKIPRGKSLPEGVKRYAAVVSYDGSAFCGFQKQKHSPSVQQELERALSSVANSEIVVSCAGRTDTAVHASYQVVHFDTPALRTGRNWVKGSNSQLPDSVALLWADEVAESFHARFSATSRTYRYVIHAAPARPAILSQGVTWVRNPSEHRGYASRLVSICSVSRTFPRSVEQGASPCHPIAISPAPRLFRQGS